MRTIDIQEALEKFRDLLAAAEQGEFTRIVRDGKDIAQVGPAAPRAGEPLPDLTEFRRAIAKSMREDAEPMSKTISNDRDEARY